MPGEKPSEMTKVSSLLAHAAVKPRSPRGVFIFISVMIFVYSVSCTALRLLLRTDSENPVRINSDVMIFSIFEEISIRRSSGRLPVLGIFFS